RIADRPSRAGAVDTPDRTWRVSVRVGQPGQDPRLQNLAAVAAPEAESRDHEQCGAQHRDNYEEWCLHVHPPEVGWVAGHTAGTRRGFGAKTGGGGGVRGRWKGAVLKPAEGVPRRGVQTPPPPLKRRPASLSQA